MYTLIDLFSQGSSHVGLVQNRTGVNFRTRTKFTEPILKLLNVPWYGHLQFHLHIDLTVIHSNLCKVETATRLLKCFFFHLCQSVYNKRCVLKPILIDDIEIIFWCLLFSNLSTPVHLYYRPQIKSIHVFKGYFWSDWFYCENENALSCPVVIFTAFESNHTASTGLSSF